MARSGCTMRRGVIVEGDSNSELRLDNTSQGLYCATPIFQQYEIW